MSLLMLSIVLISAVWVLIDSIRIGARKGLVKGLGNMGPIGWFLATLFLWIIAFPIYLYYRNKIKSASVSTPK